MVSLCVYAWVGKKEYSGGLLDTHLAFMGVFIVHRVVYPNHT